jgi:purine-binding chemotaxis protein CheW
MGGSAMDEGQRQCLTFWLLDTMFALPITVVQEVLQDVRITPIPKTPDFLEGVMNLRGRIVPVVDLKKKFAMAHTPHTEDTAVVVVCIPFENRELLAGIRVDGVESVRSFAETALCPPPQMGVPVPLDFLEAILLEEDQVLLFLNIARIFTRSELRDVRRAEKGKDGGEADDPS